MRFSLVRQEPGAGRLRLLVRLTGGGGGGGGISSVVGRSGSGTAGAEDVTGGLTSVTISGMGRVVGRNGGEAAGPAAGSAGEVPAAA